MTPETLNTAQWIMQNFGWPGIGFATVVWMLHWYITKKYPQDRADREAAEKERLALQRELAEAKARREEEWYQKFGRNINNQEIILLILGLAYPEHAKTAFAANGTKESH